MLPGKLQSRVHIALFKNLHLTFKFNLVKCSAFQVVFFRFTYKFEFFSYAQMNLSLYLSKSNKRDNS